MINSTIGNCKWETIRSKTPPGELRNLEPVKLKQQNCKTAKLQNRKIAKLIFQAAQSGEMNTTFDLKQVVSKCAHPRFLTKSLARVFQAIRIKVNDELNSLKDALTSSTQWLKSGGRIAVISFHSLEDRIVKQFFKDSAISCVCPKEYPVCVCDTAPSLRIITRKAVVPGKPEMDENPRSRSAKLRVAERI